MLTDLTNNTMKEEEKSNKLNNCFYIILLFLFLSVLMYIYNISKLMYTIIFLDDSEVEFSTYYHYHTNITNITNKI
jgi:hypothetical protein